MRIIKYGQIPEERVWRGKCRICNSIIEAQQDELKLTQDSRNEIHGEAVCPVCGKNMFLYPKKKNNAGENIKNVAE